MKQPKLILTTVNYLYKEGTGFIRGLGLDKGNVSRVAFNGPFCFAYIFKI